MGLGISHDGPHWSYSGFQLWRAAIVEAAGYEMREHAKALPFKYAAIDYGAYSERYYYGEWPHGEPSDPLLVLIVHSDCDGSIYPVHAEPLAQRIEGLLENLEPYHADYAREFIAALRRADAAGEPLEFQ